MNNKLIFSSGSKEDYQIINTVKDEIVTQKIVERIWQKDYTVWSSEPTEISNRMGWLDCLKVTKDSFEEINNFVEEVMNELLENEYILEEPYKFESEEIAKTLIKDGIRIAFSDKELHLYEMNWLKMIAEKNGISEEWCLTEYNNYKSTPNSTYKYEIERYLGQNLDNSIN